MGYWVRLYLVDIVIKKDCRPQFERLLSKHKRFSKKQLGFFLDAIMIDSYNCLGFKASGDGDVFEPDDEGSVPAMDAKWYDLDSFAECLKQFSEKDGKLIGHSLEPDGEAWGWEFDGKGRMREIAFIPVGKWR